MNIILTRFRFQQPLARAICFATIAAVVWAPNVTYGELRSAAVKEKTPFETSLESENWQPLTTKTPEAPQPFELNSSRVATPINSGGWRITAARFDEFNLTVTYANDVWVKLDPARLNPLACLVLARTNPDIGIGLVCERVGVELATDKGTLVTLSQYNMRLKSPEIKFGKEIDSSMDGVEGAEYEATLATGGQTIYWRNWVGSRNGFTYQLIAFGKVEESDTVNRAAREFREQIRVIDRARVAHAAQKDLVGHYRSETFSYELDLTGMGWIKMDPAVAKVPAVDFTALSGLGSGLVIMTIPMPHHAPNMDVLTASALAGIGLDQPGNEIVRTTPYRCENLNCKEIEISRAPEGKKVIGRVRIIADDRCAYVLYGWALAEDKKHVTLVQKSLDAFGIFSHKPLDLAKISDHQRTGCGLMLNDLGLRSFGRGEIEGAVGYFRTASELNPANEVFASNYVETVAKTDHVDEALAYLKEHESGVGSHTRLRAMRAKMLCQKGDTEAGRKLFAALFAEGYTDDVMLKAYLEVAAADKSYDEAIAAVESVLQKKSTVPVQIWQADLYGLKGDTATSLKILEALYAKYPADISVGIDLASAYIQAKQFDAALAVTQALISSGKQDEILLIVHGGVQMRMEHMAEAKQTFEHARELYPHSERVNDMLKLASSQLGEGENTCLKTTVEAVEIPAPVGKAIAQATTQNQAPATEAGAEELVHVVGIRFVPGEPLRKTTTERVKIYGPSGVSRYGTITYKFDPVFERLYVNKLVVTDDKGKRVAEGAVENYYVTDDSTSGEASNAKIAKIPVPGLKPGYTLECTVTRQTIAPVKDLSFQEISLANDSPCRISACFVQGDVDHLKWKASDGVSIEKAEKLIFAVQSNTAALRYEPHQPSVEKYSPMVWIGPADTTWKAEGETYLSLVDTKLLVDDATKATAAELTRDCHTKREKLAAIAEHVQQGYTYHAIEFGRRARIPNAASKTLALKYGDCKDHALLTRQLLAAAGIQSHLTLVRSSGAVVEELPTLDQFDHMIVFVPASEIDGPPNSIGGFLVDATNKEADPLLDPPCGMADRSVLVLDPANPKLLHTSRYASDAGKFVSNRTLTFDIKPSGTVDSHVSEEITFNAYLAPAIRGYLKRFDAGARREAIQSLLSENGPIRVKEFEALNLDAIREPLKIKLQYVVPNSFHSVASSANGKSLVGSLPCPWENEFVLAQALDCRKTPFEIATPRLIQSTLQVNLPEGYGFNNLKQCNGSGQSEFRAWASSASQIGNTVTIEYQVRMPAGRHPASAYEQYCADMNDSLAVLLTPVTFEGPAAITETASRPATVRLIR